MTPVPAPVKPLEIGKAVPFVKVRLDGVPPAPLNVTNAPADPTLTPSAVTTPVPVVVVLTTVVPLPKTTEFAASDAPEIVTVPVPEMVAHSHNAVAVL
jgi:hypothetical protein